MTFFKQAVELLISPSHSRTVGIIAVLFILAVVPLTVLVAQQQQETRQQAAFIAPTPAPFNCVDQSGLRFTCVNPLDYDTSSGCPTNWVPAAQNDSPQGTTCSSSGRICCWYNPPLSTPTPTPISPTPTKTPTPTPFVFQCEGIQGGSEYKCTSSCSGEWQKSSLTPTTCSPYQLCCRRNIPTSTPTPTPRAQPPTPTQGPKIISTTTIIPIPSPTPTAIIPPVSPTNTPAPTPTPIPALSTTCNTDGKTNADANRDGKVDGVDFDVWFNTIRQQFIVTGTCPDINGDRVIDIRDYNAWFIAMKSK